MTHLAPALPLQLSKRPLSYLKPAPSHHFALPLLLAVYGRIFTAWGTGGVLAPWLAGKLFDVTGGYSAALVVSAVSLVVSALAASVLPRDA